MKQSIKIIIAVVIVGLAAGVLAWQLRNSQNTKLREAKEAQVPIPTTVESLQLLPQTISSGFSVQGVTQPFQEVVVASEATGKISHLFVKQGDVVKAGALLCKVDATLKEIELKSANVQYDKAKNDYEKYLRLQAANNTSTAEVENAHLQMMQWGYNIKSLEQQIKESSVHAPFTGMIVEKLADVGGYLQVGTPVVNLIDIGKLKALLWLDEKAIASIKIGNQVRIRLDAMRDVLISGKVIFVNPKANESGKFQVQVEFNNTMNAKAGMTLHAFFQEGNTTEVLLIPKSALVLNSVTPAVYVLEGNKARLQSVTLGNSRENQVEVTQGIAANTTIVARGVENVMEGMILTIANTTNSNK
jgi:RND family efflux transporter MFP subunit